MKTVASDNFIQCPRCGSDALNCNGHTENGKQRYLCLVCNRQFVQGAAKDIEQRPVCPQCRHVMHVYKREMDSVRFRCSNYPHCREYIKADKERVKS